MAMPLRSPINRGYGNGNSQESRRQLTTRGKKNSSPGFEDDVATLSRCEEKIFGRSAPAKKKGKSGETVMENASEST